MKNKYRVVEHSPKCFEPQVWRWWFPIWRPLAHCSYTGYDWSPFCTENLNLALSAINNHRNPTYPPPKPIHEVP
jgi:hypothetical protein